MTDSADEVRERSSENYAELVHTIDGIVWEAEAATFEFSFVSDQAERLLGYPAAQWIQEPGFWRDHIHPEDRDFTVQYCVVAAQQGQDHEIEYRMLAADGGTVWLRHLGRAVANSDGRRARGVMVDVTAKREAAQALADSERKHRRFVEGLKERYFFYRHDREGRFTYLSPSIVHVLGYSPEQYHANYAEMFTDSPANHEAVRRTEGTLRGEVQPTYEVEVRARDGSPHRLEITEYPVWSASGEVEAVEGIARDITAAWRVEQELRESERRYRKIVELREGQSNVLEMIAAGAPLENTLEALAHLIEPQSEGLLASILLLDDDEQHLRHAAAPSLPYAYVKSIDGFAIGPRAGSCGTAMHRREPVIVTDILEDPLWEDYRHLAVPYGLRACWSTPIMARQGHVLGSLAMYYREVRAPQQFETELIGIATRIAAIAIERDRSEHVLERSEAQYRRLFEAHTDGIALLEFESGRITKVNPALTALLGLTPGSLVGRTLFEVTPLRDALGTSSGLPRLQSERGLRLDNLPLETEDGRRRTLEFSSNVYLVDGTKVIQCNVRDVTERTLAREMQATTYRIAAAATTGEGLSDLLWAVHANLNEMMAAQNFYVALHDEAAGSLSFPYWADERDERPPPRLLGQALTDHVLRTGSPLHATAEVTTELVRQGKVDDRSRPHTDWIGVPLRAHGRTVGVLVVRSYTQSVSFGVRELEILQFVSTQVGMAIERRRAEEALRESEATYRSLVENSPYGIYRATPEGRFTSVNPALVRLLGYGTKDEVQALDLGKVSGHPGECSRVSQAFRESEYVPVEAHWRRKDGRAITVRLTGRAVRDEQGEVEQYEAIVEDVSERRALEDQLRQAQKIEAVGRLAGGIAHDFNNILNVILGYTELLQRSPALSDIQRDKLSEIRKAGERAAGLTHQLLAFSRKQILQPRVLDLNEIVEEMEKMLRRLIGEDVQLVTVLGPRLGCVKADRGQMEQVLMNLAVNARDAMPQGGTLLVETANLELDDEEARHQVEARPGSYVVLSVIDTGDGMDPETLSHIFEPFFTTREQGHGTGLGLATVYGIVKQSGGYITVRSTPGKGSSFRVFLPVTAEKAATSLASASTAPPGASETVLLVEDDAALRGVVQEVLEDAGYRVLTRNTPEQALELARTHSGEIHLLLTDVIMPGLNGPQVAEHLRVMRPRTRILYMSGYTDEALGSRTALGRDTPFIQKPFTTDNLLRVVGEVLKGPEPGRG